MILQKKLFFAKNSKGLYWDPTGYPKDDHILKIEAHQNISNGTNDLIPPVEYHLHDNRANPDLPGIHVVLTVYYNRESLGDKFHLSTRPTALKKNFSAVLKWSPKDIVKAITIMEKEMSSRICDKNIFSTTSDWEIQYYGLIRELYRKGLK